MAITWTRGELWDKIVEQAQKNPKYYDLLVSDPRALVEKQLGVCLAPGVKIEVLQESPDTYYIVLPAMAKDGAELSDADLEKVAGGKDLGQTLSTVGGAVGSAFGPVGGLIGGAAGGVLGGLMEGSGSSGGGGGAATGGGAGASCAATDSAVGTTVVDISL